MISNSFEHYFHNSRLFYDHYDKLNRQYKKLKKYFLKLKSEKNLFFISFQYSKFIMEQTLKKKTKQLINLRTNNFIQTQIQKQVFFNEVLTALQQQFDPKQYQFLTAYLLIHQNANQKKHKFQLKNTTQKRIQTQPEQRTNNLSQIDTNLFHQQFGKSGMLLLKNKCIKTKQLDINCTNTPKKQVKQILFQNKKLYDLDKKLQRKYSHEKNKLIYQPKMLLTQSKQNKKNGNFIFRTSFQRTFFKGNKKKQLHNMMHSQERNIHSQDRKIRHLNLKENLKQNNQHYKSKNRLKTEGIDFSQRFSQNTNWIPEHIFKRTMKENKTNKQIGNDFSDFKFKHYNQYRQFLV